MKLYIVTQDQENYGSHDWDGKGECPQYWKSKGGSDFMVPLGDSVDTPINDIVEAVRSKIEENSTYYRSNIVAWEVVSDDFVTEFEKSQLEFDGKIYYHPREIEFTI